MNQQTEYSKQAELALAAYGDFATQESTRQKLIAAEFSKIQADAFILKYRIVDQYTDITGLSATVFADADNKTFLAIRGTEASDPMDLLTDLINITWLGSTTLQPQYISLKFKVAEWIENGVLPQNFTVTGHSLGGFWAAGLVAEPVFTNHVSHAYLYNAPGVGGYTGPSAAAYAILDFLGVASTYDQSKISNIESATGISPISGLGFWRLDDEF